MGAGACRSRGGRTAGAGCTLAAVSAANSPRDSGEREFGRAAHAEAAISAANPPRDFAQCAAWRIRRE